MRKPDMKINPKNIKPGEEYNGYHSTDGASHLCRVTVMEDGTPLVFEEYPIKEEIDYFTRRMTWDEEKEWLKSQIDMTNSRHQLNLLGLHNDLYSVGDAHHEMWNGWVCCEWMEQLVELLEEDFFIVGVAEAPYGCWAIDDPVAIVAEYDDSGDRIWCHAGRDWVKTMREESKSEYEALMNGKM